MKQVLVFYLAMKNSYEQEIKYHLYKWKYKQLFPPKVTKKWVTTEPGKKMFQAFPLVTFMEFP